MAHIELNRPGLGQIVGRTVSHQAVACRDVATVAAIADADGQGALGTGMDAGILTGDRNCPRRTRGMSRQRWQNDCHRQ